MPVVVDAANRIALESLSWTVLPLTTVTAPVKLFEALVRVILPEPAVSLVSSVTLRAPV